MLIFGACGLSAASALLLWLFGALPGPGWLPAAFVSGVPVFLLLWSVSCAICAYTVNLKKPCQKRSRLFRFYTLCILDTLRQVLRVRLHIRGMEKLPQQPFLLVGNHRSALDPILEMWALRKYHLGFVAKQELFRIPVVGRLMHKCFCFSLDRGSLRDGLKVMDQAAAAIQSGQAAVGIYPEGTRSRDGRLLPFQNGAFRIAQKANCPIVVAVIRNSEQIMRQFSLGGKDVFLDIAAVIPAEEAAACKTVQLSRRVHQLMEKALIPAETGSA